MGRSIGRFPAQEPTSREWTLSFYPDAIYLEPPSADHTAFTLDHRAFVERTTLHVFPRAEGTLVVRGGPKPITLNLSSGHLKVLREWLGPTLDEHLTKKLRGERLAGVVVNVVVGVLWVVPGPKFHVLARPVGVGCLLLAGAIMVKPHRALLLAAAVLWVGIDVSLALNAIDGSLLWLASLIPVPALIVARVREFWFYGPPPGA